MPIAGGGRGGGSGGALGRRWAEELSPEVLALIFVRLPADELCRTVPFVCRSWRDVVAGPYCWSEEIDLERWCRRVNRSDLIDAAVRLLTRRSSGNLRRLSAYRLGCSAFSFVVVSCRFLRVLQIPMSDVTDQLVLRLVESLKYLTVLDISYCLNITSVGIEALGRHCESLIELRRNMPPQSHSITPVVNEGEALAIACNMVKLQHLELVFGQFSDCGLEAILTRCNALRVLDIRGCWNVKMDSNIQTLCDSVESFKGPCADDYDDTESSGNEQQDSSCDEGDFYLEDVDTSDESEDY